MEIKDGVTSIDPTAFVGNSTLNKVTITGKGKVADELFVFFPKDKKGEVIIKK